MRAEKLNTWLTLGANIGVLIGLLLLVVELDQNSDVVRAQIHQARSDNFEAFNIEIADTEYLLPALAKLRAAGGPRDVLALQELDAIERERVRMYFRGRVMGYDNLHYQYESGFLDEEFYKIRVEGSIRALAPIWAELGLINLGAENPRVSPSFAAEIERVLSEE
jgi:hypothetical protein